MTGIITEDFIPSASQKLTHIAVTKMEEVTILSSDGTESLVRTSNKKEGRIPTRIITSVLPRVQQTKQQTSQTSTVPPKRSESNSTQRSQSSVSSDSSMSITFDFGNLPKSTTPNMLSDFCSNYGTVKIINLIPMKATDSTRQASLEMRLSVSLDSFLSAANKHQFKGLQPSVVVHSSPFSEKSIPSSIRTYSFDHLTDEIGDKTIRGYCKRYAEVKQIRYEEEKTGDGEFRRALVDLVLKVPHNEFIEAGLTASFKGVEPFISLYTSSGSDGHVSEYPMFRLSKLPASLSRRQLLQACDPHGRVIWIDLYPKYQMYPFRIAFIAIALKRSADDFLRSISAITFSGISPEIIRHRSQTAPGQSYPYSSYNRRSASPPPSVPKGANSSTFRFDTLPMDITEQQLVKFCDRFGSTEWVHLYSATSDFNHRLAFLGLDLNPSVTVEAFLSEAAKTRFGKNRPHVIQDKRNRVLTPTWIRGQGKKSLVQSYEPSSTRSEPAKDFLNGDDDPSLDELAGGRAVGLVNKTQLRSEKEKKDEEERLRIEAETRRQEEEKLKADAARREEQEKQMIEERIKAEMRAQFEKELEEKKRQALREEEEKRRASEQEHEEAKQRLMQQQQEEEEKQAQRQERRERNQKMRDEEQLTRLDEYKADILNQVHQLLAELRERELEEKQEMLLEKRREQLNELKKAETEHELLKKEMDRTIQKCLRDRDIQLEQNRIILAKQQQADTDEELRALKHELREEMKTQHGTVAAVITASFKEEIALLTQKVNEIQIRNQLQREQDEKRQEQIDRQLSSIGQTGSNPDTLLAMCKDVVRASLPALIQAEVRSEVSRQMLVLETKFSQQMEQLERMMEHVRTLSQSSPAQGSPLPQSQSTPAASSSPIPVRPKPRIGIINSDFDRGTMATAISVTTGMRVEILSELKQGGWTKVRIISSGVSGYVPGDYIKLQTDG
ncbi:hypothetical protein BLNAU_11332 [Blattamonas nauphoetae]|uniref:SH3 domain-containing protein n=1 Tax=Blattamonas nauphoetae TaxID=2049346 RepID=A0ABQ9XR72_9EUKA|nr:hypothetical protein BLNAU_11332 [Blattamonas nauphoetae]